MKLVVMRDEIEMQTLRSQAGAFKELLEAYEKAVLEQADKLYKEIAERKRAEEAVLKSHKELEKAYDDLKHAQATILQQEKMASIGQIAAGVAHEINNPVGYIISNLGTLRKYADRLSEFIKIQSEAIDVLSKDTERQGTTDIEALKKVNDTGKTLRVDYILKDLGDLVRESNSGAERIKSIVQDLKSFSHVNEAEFKMSDINEGIKNTINVIWNELKYKAKVIQEYGDVPLTRCNQGNLNQVFLNILVNAAQAIEKQGEIVIKTWSDGKNICISISDTGCGIPEENIHKIFEPFFTTKEVGKGTGLGMSITYDIVKKHNGEITVESKIGKGTVFTVKLPVVEK